MAFDFYFYTSFKYYVLFAFVSKLNSRELTSMEYSKIFIEIDTNQWLRFISKVAMFF